MTTDDIHTCSNECQRPTCVAVREAVAAEREACVKEIQSEICDEIEDEAYSILVGLLARIKARGGK